MRTSEAAAGTPVTVAIVGGSGRLGTLLCSRLVEEGCSVRVVDKVPPRLAPSLRVEYCHADVEREGSLTDALSGCDSVAHLAGLHGLHLRNGVSRSAVWRANVLGTSCCLDASRAAGVRRLVLASSTSVYGPGSEPGKPALILNETMAPNPQDVYDLSKLAAERIVRHARHNGEIEAVSLRFGRFFSGSVVEYNLRKLSTGLDARDAVEAAWLALRSDQVGDMYCVASDLPLPVAERLQLGSDAPAVVERLLPGLRQLLQRRGWDIPHRVGKTVDTSLIRAELGYVPRWTISTWYEALKAEIPDHRRVRPSPEVFSGDPFDLLEDTLQEA